MLGWDIGLELIGISTQQRMRDNIFQSHITSAAVGGWCGSATSCRRPVGIVTRETECMKDVMLLVVFSGCACDWVGRSQWSQGKAE